MSISVAVISASGGAEEDGVEALFSPRSFFGTFSKSPAKEANFDPIFFDDFFSLSSSSGLRLLLLLSCFFLLSLSFPLSLSRGDLSLFFSFLLGEGDRLPGDRLRGGGGESLLPFRFSTGGGELEEPRLRLAEGGGDLDTDFLDAGAGAGEGLRRPCFAGFFRSRLRERDLRSRDRFRSRPLPPPPPPPAPRR